MPVSNNSTQVDTTPNTLINVRAPPANTHTHTHTNGNIQTYQTAHMLANRNNTYTKCVHGFSTD